MSDPLERLRQKVAGFRAEVNAHLDKLPGPMCAEHAEQVADTFVQLDRWQVMFDNWAGRKEELDNLPPEAHDLVVSFVADCLTLLGVDDSEGEPV